LRSDKPIILAQFAASFLALAILGSGGHTAGSWIAALSFFVVALVLGLFDVWLPLGDLADMTGAVAFAAIVLVEPLPAFVAVAAARVVSALLRREGQTPWRVLDDIGRRLVVMAATLLLTTYTAALGGSMGEYPRIVGAAVFFFVLDTLIAQVHASIRLQTSYLTLVVGYLRLQGLMVAAQASIAVLTVLVYSAMRAWSLAIAFGLLLVMRQSFSLLLDVRRAYRSTVEVLVRAIEVQDPERRGHAERVARRSSEAGRMLGLHGRRLESLRYAALFHDVGQMGEVSSGGEESSGAEVLSSVGFLASSVPILQILESGGMSDGSEDESDLVAAYVISYISAVDEDLTVGGRRGTNMAEAVGSRLYVSTRRSADRVLRRIERRMRTGQHALSEMATSH
jgi:hypothetical protein